MKVTTIFGRAMDKINLAVNGLSSCRREIVMEDGYQMKYWLEKKNTSLTSPLELVIHDRLSENRIQLRQRIFTEEARDLMDKFDRGDALGQIFPDIGDTRDKASQLAAVEKSMAYYQYHGYGQNCTVHSANLDQALRAHQSRRISYGS